ncbi:low-specificity L-threonine aldolase [Anoxynatronum sibiricum]|uniref:Low-specificity L-threonine aldolase n=1 Tax=Anoxynatronum sibiricum TaxID=210623 RepID=A0ABU9VPZ3_9CLOT
MNPIDLRSDTVTQPTPEMIKAMSQAPLGDDVYGDDPTVNRLEAMAAEKLGKEASLLVPTGTMGNLIAVLTHTKPGQEMILEEKSHIFLYEVASVARIAGVQTRPLCGPRGQMNLECIEEAIRPDNIHFPETGLIALENTHNMYGGAVLPLEYMKKVFALAQSRNLPVHLDGARIFNAATALKRDVREIAQYTDSVMFCLSKGLGAPVGSMLVGSQTFINTARKHRKMLGGGMRQAGVLAACGLVALEHMVERLHEDHDNARFLAEELLKTGHFITQPESVKTNIVNAVLDSEKNNAFDLLEKMAQNGVLANARSRRHFRFVTHKDVSRDQIMEAVAIFNHILR